MGKVITIDGPAASGKSSVSRELAQRLSCTWLSTGAFYRGLAYVALQMNIELDDVQSISQLSQSPIWKVQMTPARTLVFFRDQDVTNLISHEDVGNFASRISHYPDVRKSLLAAQRNCATTESCLIAEGRDCGTVVFPSAEAKIYLTASSEHRAARRAAEQGSSAQEIKESQKVRDQQDATRKVAPLQIPDGAFVVDASELNLSQVVDKIEVYVKQKLVI
ncbi:MAG: (d)CMP kinase [Bdellovibrionota bacterium]